MNHHHHQPPLTLRPVASRGLLIFAILVHVSALLVLLPLPLHWIIKLAVVALILTSFGYALWVSILYRAPWSIVEATWTDSGWRLTTATGSILNARLDASTYIGVGLVILNLRSGLFSSHSMLLTADNIGPDRLRRLRARLRLSSTITDLNSSSKSISI